MTGTPAAQSSAVVGHDSVVRELVRLAAPAILASLLQSMVFLADRLMLGRYGQDALASMQLQGPVMWSVFSIFMGTLVGTVAVVARSVGAADHGRARAAARTSLRLSLIVGLGVGLLGVASIDIVVALLGSGAEHVDRLSATYMRIGYIAIPGLFLATTAAMVLQGAGDTRTPFIVGLVSNSLNVALNWLLIFGVEGLAIEPLGVAGAAIATVIAFTVEAVLLLAFLARTDHIVYVAPLWRRVDEVQRALEVRARRDILALSAPAVLDRIAVHAGFLGFVRIITILGPVAMASNQALVTLESICFLSADGFGIAAATVVGQRLGRSDRAGARHGGWVATWLAVFTLSSFGLLIWLTGAWTLEAFVPTGEPSETLVVTAMAALPVLAIAQPFMACGVVLAQGLRGAGDTKSPLLSALTGGLVVRVTAAWVLGVELGLGLVGVWIASTIDWALRTVVLTIVFFRGRWARIEL